MTPRRRKSFVRISVEVPTDLHKDLKVALVRRAKQIAAQTGVEQSAELAPFFRAKIREAVAAYK